MSTDDMPQIVHYQGQVIECRPHETLLEACLRQGVEVDFSCKSGVCHRCMVRCVEGEIPEAARRKLPQHQQDNGCMLLCQCRPAGPMLLAPKSPEDLLTRCMAMAVQPQDQGHWQLVFEPMRTLSYRTGQLARVMGTAQQDSRLGILVSDPEQDAEWTVSFGADQPRPDWLAEEHGEFLLQGPLPVEPRDPIVPLPPDPELWAELGGDAVIRAVLTTFYTKVYADAALAPFFERVTMDRIIGKQFAFLKEHIQGLPVFLGEQPRNSHNWMVIHDALFDHRQNLMIQAMREHGLTDELIARWSRHEEQFRTEIVKYKPWPKRFGDLVVDTEQYETCPLDEATVCDYCGEEIPRGTVVRFHKRLGKLGCALCAPATQTGIPA